MAFPPKPGPPPPPFPITIDGMSINPVNSARCFRVIFDQSLSFSNHINNTAKTCHFFLRNIAKICPFLSQVTANPCPYPFPLRLLQSPTNQPRRLPPLSPAISLKLCCQDPPALS
ncbi:hypothetical protein XENTR_v10000134 [Xenopus tropicalis]|nr:hypothetical protein XENTR_v10000134 [Xenopus tropicalis]